MLRAILFDFNGVLVDDEPLHFELFRHVLGEEGIDLSERDYYRDYVGFDDRAAFRFALGSAGRDADETLIMGLGARKASAYQDAIRVRGFPFFDGAVELVRALAAKGVTLGLVSGALRSEVEPALGQHGLLELFKSVVTADDVEASKPDPEGYRRSLRDLNTQPPLPERIFHPHEVLAIEDTVAGIEAAAAAGLVTLGLTHTHPACELWAADFVAGEIGELTASWLEERLGQQ